MTLVEPIILIDLPSRSPNKCWSQSPWKTRFVLNYKRLEYKTEWIEYPDLKSRLEGWQAVPPNLEGNYAYTSPTIRLPDGTWVMDSQKIAAVLEERYPNPSLHLDSLTLPQVEKLLLSVRVPLRPLLLKRLPDVLLNDISSTYWYETRERDLGMTLIDFEEKESPKAWVNAEPILKEITDLLNELEGPFFMGHEVSYADFLWAGYLLFVGRVGDDLLEKLIETSGDKQAHERLLQGVSPWSMRDDH